MCCADWVVRQWKLLLTDTVPSNVSLVIVNSTKAAYSQKEQFLPGIVLFGYRERHKQIEGWFLVGLLRNNLKVHPKGERRAQQ